MIITDVVKTWPAWMKWSEPWLCENYGQVPFKVADFTMPLDDFDRYSRACRDERPLYLFDSQFAAKCPELGTDYEVPPYFADDLFGVLDESRPDYRWLIMGPARSGSSFHVDPNGTSAWNAVLTGKKKWVMFPPDTVPPGIVIKPDGTGIETPASLIEWCAPSSIQAFAHCDFDCLQSQGWCASAICSPVRCAPARCLKSEWIRA